MVQKPLRNYEDIQCTTPANQYQYIYVRTTNLLVLLRAIHPTTDLARLSRLDSVVLVVARVTQLGSPLL